MSTLGTEADALAIELIEAAGDEKRTLAIALRLTALAVRLHQQEAAVVPPHLREAAAALPPARQRRTLPEDDRAGDGHERDADQELDGRRRRVRAGPGGDVRQGGRAGRRQGGEGGDGALHHGPPPASGPGPAPAW